MLDGRDIGTVVLPNADLKFFIDADINIRADRRTKELRQAGQSAMFRDILADMQMRDDRDRSRSVAPMRAAEDAITIDTSNLDASEVLQLALGPHLTRKHRIGIKSEKGLNKLAETEHCEQFRFTF